MFGRKFALQAALGSTALLLAGCGTVALRHSMDNYGDVYAETQNRQMLLNLARLHDREPAYFFQLAQISSSYTFTETAAMGGTKSTGIPTSSTANIRTFTGSVGGTAVHNPIFTLVPLAGDKFAQQLLSPIKPDIFYELYDEGWPVDLLMRVLIERVEIDTSGIALPAEDEKNAADQNGTDRNAALKIVQENQILALENNPWLYIQDTLLPSNASAGGPIGNYDRFLRACALAREFQRHGLLFVETTKQFEQVAPVSFGAPSATELEEAAKNGLVWLPADEGWVKKVQSGIAVDPWETYDVGPAEKKPEDKSTGGRQVAGANADEGKEKKDQKRWVLVKVTSVPHFRLTAGATVDALRADLRNKDEFKTPEHPLDLFNYVMQNGGFSVTDNTAKGGFKLRLVMRSLMGAMTALAQEQEGFELFKQRYGEIHDLKEIPKLEQEPALTLNPVGEDLQEVVSLDYRGRHYAIADARGTSDNPQAGWNRDVFRLLAQLSFLATTDPSAFTSQQFIQLR